MDIVKTFPSIEEAKRLVQEKGIKSMRDYKALYKCLGLPSSPSGHYKDKGWIDWYDFLGTKPKKLPPYEEAQRIVQDRGIKQISEYLTFYRELGLPSEPHNTYKGKGWTNWFDFLGKSGGSYPTYEEAKGVLQEKGIKSIPQYKSSYKELGLPSAPERHYKDKGWGGWYDFLGKERDSFPSYEEAQRIVLEKGIRNTRDYKSSYKELGLPSQPDGYYKGKGWIAWSVFLNKSPKKTSKERETRILTKLSINSILLQEDMPLKVLYMYAVEVDKRIAKEIEEILGIVSYEERLKWVNELLKSLKESSTIKGTTPSEESLDDILVGGSDVEDSDEIPNELLELGTMIDDIEEAPDEYSAIESVIEEFDDVKDTLSEKASTRINTQLENYLHSIVNKELIKEVDGE